MAEDEREEQRNQEIARLDQEYQLQQRLSRVTEDEAQDPAKKHAPWSVDSDYNEDDFDDHHDPPSSSPPIAHPAMTAAVQISFAEVAVCRPLCWLTTCNEVYMLIYIYIYIYTFNP